MKLLILSTEFPPGPGGIGTHAYELARQFGQMGRSVTVLTPQDYATPSETDAFNAAQNFRVSRFRTVPGAPAEATYRLVRLATTIARFRPDVLLATGMRAVWLAAAVPGETPWIAVGHGTEFGVGAKWSRALSRWAYGKAHAVVCVSDYTRLQMERMGIRAQAISVIHNGADASRFAPLPVSEIAAFRQRIGFPKGHLLLTVGRVSKRKGQDVVIRAMPRVLASVPDAHYLMAGIPEKEPEFRLLARELGVEAHVHFLGRTAGQDLTPLLNACDLFLMTSTNTADGDFEGFGIAVLEAALCGKPAIVSRGSGVTESIQEGLTGLAVTQDDAEATASAIVDLLRNDARRHAMGTEARRRALENQTWQQVALRYSDVLEGVAFRPVNALSRSYR